MMDCKTASSMLNLCPFCGHRAVVHQSITQGKFFAKCINSYCGAAIWFLRETPEMAVEAWNTRYTEPEPETESETDTQAEQPEQEMTT